MRASAVVGGGAAVEGQRPFRWWQASRSCDAIYIANERPDLHNRFTKLLPGTLQEGGAPFQTTHWTLVLQAGNAEADDAAQKALATFTETYWPSLYTFVRRRGYSPADAQDIVQGFFVHLLEQRTLSRADQERGRLRTFLLGAIEKFMLKQRERMGALKRGGGQQIVSFDEQLIDAEAAIQASPHLSDTTTYDIAWASSVLARAWKNVRERFVAEGKREWFDALRPFVSGGTAVPPNQQEVADQLGTSVENLRVAVSRLRQRYRHALRAEVASTVSDPKDVDSELHYLYQVLTS